uniref:Shieldin complex subunit 1 n=1 Tax=Suricata suricatta TaxID=37032 RepID=A0A673TMV1_SURSU
MHRIEIKHRCPRTQFKVTTARCRESEYSSQEGAWWGSTCFSDTSNLNSEQNDSWISENFSLDPSVKGQVKTKAEDDGLRKSLDRFYEMFGHPQPASGDPLSASVCQCLSQKINELKGQETQKYALRSFQMARVIFNRDGCSVLRRRSRDVHFYPLEEGRVSLDDEKPTPGLSKDIIHFLMRQMKDL